MKNHNAGFTLIELILYIALFGILMSGAVITTFQLLQGGHRNIRVAAIEEEGTFLIRKINWSLSGATSASVKESNTLFITKPDGSSDTFSSDGKNLLISRSGSAPAILNSDAFTIDHLYFSTIPPTNEKPTFINATFTIEDVPFTLNKYLR